MNKFLLINILFFVAIGFSFGQSVTTGAVTNKTATTVTLNGTLNPSGTMFGAQFDYGITDSYGSSIASDPNYTSADTETSVSANLTGLMPKHYRYLRHLHVSNLLLGYCL